MAVVMAPPQDVRPPSPALTNPDMILPYVVQDKSKDSSIQRTLAAELTPPQTSRPTLPGAWFSEEDVRPAQTTGNSSLHPGLPSNLPLKSPVGRFLNTLNPGMRQGIGIEVPEYSPSIYSPTDPEGRTPIGEDEPQEAASAFGGSQAGEKSSSLEDEDVMGARAEEILAIAKQRLLAMESNLNRARTMSLGTTTTEIASPTTPTKERTIPQRLQKSSSGSHLRMSSDTKVTPSKLTYDPTIRSASALGSPSPFNSFIHKHHHLEPLNEDDFIDSSPSEYDRPRTSMRDLQEQMDNLKGKINSLKQKSREDSMRRRSLQALKAPSPFTDADIGAASPYREHMRPESNSSDRSLEFLGNQDQLIKNFDSEKAEKGPLVKFKSDEKDEPNGETFFHDGSVDEEEEETVPQQGDARRSIVLPPSTDEAIPTPVSETAILDHVDSEEPETIIPSSPTYETDFLNPELPPMPEQQSPAHEDRPDAFDYETYILNSTMGSYSRTGFRSRPTSTSSAGSASTQRPMHDAEGNEVDDLLRPPHVRNKSTDSTSSTATFTTAITGRGDSRANSRTSRTKGIVGAGYLSPQLPSQSSYTNLRLNAGSATALHSPLKNSFSPLASPSAGVFPATNTSISAEQARTEILSLLLRSAPVRSTDESKEHESGRVWATEDEKLFGTVIDGLIKVAHRIVNGDDSGGAGRSVLESIGAVLHK